MNLPIQLYRVKSRATGKEYTIGYPSADTDMATDGLLILVSKVREEIQLHKATAEEYPLGPFYGAVRRAKSENQKNGRNDLAAVAVDLDVPSRPGSISRFAFRDIMNEAGHADPISSRSVEDYRSRGGIFEDKRYG